MRVLRSSFVSGWGKAGWRREMGDPLNARRPYGWTGSGIMGELAESSSTLPQREWDEYDAYDEWERIKPDQGQSNQIKPRAAGDSGQWLVAKERGAEFGQIGPNPTESSLHGPIRPNPTKSNQIQPAKEWWSTDSGWWRKRRAECGPVKPSQTGVVLR